ncbi:MAG: hypothetical protein JJE42_00875 [Burkholderiales bacterium]|nr:hypothetical protein [Burkholderiales bacterium]
MNDALLAAEKRLKEILAGYSPLAIAVSGGVDSLTLATVAHRVLPVAPLMVHAVSPAVPLAATERVREMSGREGWSLREISAGEFADPDYRANPYNRCYFCKSNLYRSIRTITDRRIASGANLDDLSDYRPGLKAAAERDVVHPFVDASIDKTTIRQIARVYQLHHYSDLPAQPCLASRVETGLPIRAGDLSFIDEFESELRQTLGELSTVRVRIRKPGVYVELGEMPDQETAPVLEARARRYCEQAGYAFVAITAYRQGSAFVKEKAT